MLIETLRGSLLNPLWLILLLIMPAEMAFSSMLPDRSVLTFRSQGPARQDINVSNRGDEYLFVEVEVMEVANPGTAGESRNIVRIPEMVGMVAAPRRLVIPPGSRRQVRLVNMRGHGEVERVYRINLMPVVVQSEDEETMGVRLIVGYQLLVFVAPEIPNVVLDGRREGGRMHLYNRGNVNVFLSDGLQCSVSSGECQGLRGLRLYPGRQAVLDLPFDDGVVEFDMTSVDGRVRRRFD